MKSKRQQVIDTFSEFPEKVHDMLVMMAEGSSTEDIAEALGWQITTVKTKCYLVLHDWGIDPGQEPIRTARTAALAKDYQSRTVFGMHHKSDDCECAFCLQLYGPIEER